MNAFMIRHASEVVELSQPISLSQISSAAADRWTALVLEGCSVQQAAAPVHAHVWNYAQLYVIYSRSRKDSQTF